MTNGSPPGADDATLGASPEPPPPPAFVLVRRVRDDRGLDGWSLVLTALGIAHEIAQTGDGGWALVVAPSDAHRARTALDAHDREAREEAAAPEPPAPDRGPSWAGLVVAAGLIVFFLVTGERGGIDREGWFRAGSAIAEKIVAGELYRAVTALTLHADLMHVVGNAVATIIFLGAAGRWIGGGLATLLALLAGTAGNLAVAWSYGARHNSVGASTGTFAALGLLGGLQFVRWFSAGDLRMRRRRAFTAIAACMALFAMLGVGERSDVLAHATGLLFGLAAGVGAGLLVRRRILGTFGQTLCALASLGLVIGAWILARR